MEQKFYICGQMMVGLVPGAAGAAAETHAPAYQAEAVCAFCCPHSLRKA